MTMQKIYLLSNKSYEDIENIEVFDISYINQNIDFSLYDALIFTSKNAIYAIDSFNNDWKSIPSYAIAKKTANELEKLNSNLVFTGLKSHGNDFAQELIPLLKNKRVLYLRAKKTVSKLVEILKNNNIDIQEKVVYETVCKKSMENYNFKENSIFIFTSPSSYNCFLKNFKWNKSFIAIAIGKTTAKEFHENTKYFVSEETSIEACIKLAKSIQ